MTARILAFHPGPGAHHRGRIPAVALPVNGPSEARDWPGDEKAVARFLGGDERDGPTRVPPDGPTADAPGHRHPSASPRPDTRPEPDALALAGLTAPRAGNRNGAPGVRQGMEGLP